MRVWKEERERNILKGKTKEGEMKEKQRYIDDSKKRGRKERELDGWKNKGRKCPLQKKSQTSLIRNIMIIPRLLLNHLP